MVFDAFFDGIKHTIGTFNLMTTIAYLLIAFLMFLVVMLFASVILMFIWVWFYSCFKCFPLKWRKKKDEIIDIEYGPDHNMASNNKPCRLIRGNCGKGEEDNLTDNVIELDNEDIVKFASNKNKSQPARGNCGKQMEEDNLTDSAFEMDEDEMIKVATSLFPFLGSGKVGEPIDQSTPKKIYSGRSAREKRCKNIALNTEIPIQRAT